MGGPPRIWGGTLKKHHVSARRLPLTSATCMLIYLLQWGALIHDTPSKWHKFFSFWILSNLQCMLAAHGASNPAKTKFNIITPYFQKKAFWEGGIFLEFFHEFLGLRHKKNFGKTLGQNQCFGIIICQFRPFCDFSKFKKSGIFSIFGQIWQLFFFKIQFWTMLYNH